MADQDLLDKIANYYVDLLILQYRGKQKACDTIQLLVKTTLAEGIAFDLQQAFDLELAVGAQLDILGKYIGLSRAVSVSEINPSSEYFGFLTQYEVDGFGMTDNAGFGTIDAHIFGANEDDTLSSSLLNDEDYRTLLKLKIIQNHSNHSEASITQSLYDFFGNDIILSSKDDMTMVYFTFPNAEKLVEIAIKNGILPKPAGVGVKIVIKVDQVNSKFFGFAGNNPTAPISSLVTGFSTAADFSTKVGKMLTINDIIYI